MGFGQTSRRAFAAWVACLVTLSAAAALTATWGGPAYLRVTASSGPAPAGWVNVTPALSPPGVGGGMMAYSTSARRFVLFGGSDGDPTNGTWAFDPVADAWSPLHPAVSPPVRVDGMFTYDSAADAFILFGGWYETPSEVYVRLGDTWTFYLGNDTWVPRHPSRSPSPRSDAAVAYDPADDVTVLAGGFNGTAYVGDEWAYGLANDTWWPLSFPLMPSPRADGRMAYDRDTSAFYLYGGNDYSGPNFTYHHLGDTWTLSWKTGAWTQLLPRTSPGALDYAVLAADTATGDLLLSGGYGASVVLGGTWAFNTTRVDWAPVTAAAAPSPRMAAVGGYDPAADVFVVFSGGDKVSVKDDTWALHYPPTLVASATASATDAVPGADIGFAGQAAGGTGFVTAATWSFGDGSSAAGTNVTHAFPAAGVYSVTFTVTDDRGATSSATIQVTVGVPGPLVVGLAGVVTAFVAMVSVALYRSRRSRGPGKPG